MTLLTQRQAPDDQTDTTTPETVPDAPGDGVTDAATDEEGSSTAEGILDALIPDPVEDAATATAETAVDIGETVLEGAETVAGAPGDVVEGGIDVATSDPVDLATDVAGDVVFGPGISALNEAGADLAGTAFGDLADTLAFAGAPVGLALGGIEVSIHIIAAHVAFAIIATTVLFAMLVPRRKLSARLGWLSAATIRYVLIASFGVVVGLFAIEASGELTGLAVEATVGEDGPDVSGANLYTGAVAAVVIPLVKVALEFQQFLVAILIAVWPLAAAVSISRTFRHLLPIVTALIAANVLWPPIAALALGKSFTALPDVGAATWWALAALVVAVAFNGVALAARSSD
ncbi:MAG: hypothetical protein AAF962_18920 [Actinomycetota bacterium]